MIPMTSVDVLRDLLKFGKELIPLLTEKKLDGIIAGLAEARSIVDRHKEIQIEIVAADEKLAKATAAIETADKKLADLKEAKAELTVAGKALDAREVALAAKEKEIEALVASLAKKNDKADKDAAKLEVLLGKAEADGKEIEATKESLALKLAKLSEIA